MSPWNSGEILRGAVDFGTRTGKALSEQDSTNQYGSDSGAGTQCHVTFPRQEEPQALPSDITGGPGRRQLWGAEKQPGSLPSLVWPG